MHMRGTDLKAWRKGLKITQAEAATLLGRSLRMVIMYEKETAPIPDEVPFTIVEGWRIRDIDAALAAAGRIAPGQYAAAAERASSYTATFPLPEGTLEGYLYPETYNVPASGMDPRQLVQRQLDTFGSRFFQVEGQDLGGRSLHDVVTMASLLEREDR